LIIIPVVVYQVAKFFVPELAFAFLILAAMPTAMTAPLFTTMARGKQSFSLVLSIVTSLIVPVSAPFIIKLLAPTTVTIDLTRMVIRLGMVILIPILLAEFIKHATPKIGKALNSISRTGSLGALGLLLIGVISVHASTIINAFTHTPTHYLIPLVVFFIVLHLIGYFLFFWLPHTKKIAATVSIAYMNFTLAIYIASTFFPQEEILLPIIISAIPWSIAIIPFAEIAARHEINTPSLVQPKKREIRRGVPKRKPVKLRKTSQT
jgi:predicted Na+-dependent transporter